MIEFLKNLRDAGSRELGAVRAHKVHEGFNELTVQLIVNLVTRDDDYNDDDAGT